MDRHAHVVDTGYFPTEIKIGDGKILCRRTEHITVFLRLRKPFFDPLEDIEFYVVSLPFLNRFADRGARAAEAIHILVPLSNPPLGPTTSPASVWRAS